MEGRTGLQYLWLVLKGMAMGAADVVPGVSGGTMAFILGIYEELIDAIKSFDLKSLQCLVTLKFRSLLDRISWQFLLSVGMGILAAVFTLSKLLSWLLQNRPVFIWSFFLGLILASVLSVSRRVEAWRILTGLCLVGGTLGSYFLVGLVPVSTPNDYWFLFLCGAVAICAMILPGISGSYILVLLGKYRYVLDAVNHREFIVIGLVAAGAVVDFFRIDEHQLDPAVVGDPAVVQGLVQALVGLRQIDIFTHNGDIHGIRRLFIALHEKFPIVQMGQLDGDDRRLQRVDRVDHAGRPGPRNGESTDLLCATGGRARRPARRTPAGSDWPTPRRPR